jgi:IS5 family transposase
MSGRRPRSESQNPRHRRFADQKNFREVAPHYTKTRFKGLAKNTVQIVTLFALANLYAVRKQLLPTTGQLRLKFG